MSAVTSDYNQPSKNYVNYISTDLLAKMMSTRATAFIAEANFLERKLLSKGHLGSCSRLETYQQSRRTFGIFGFNN